MTTDELRAYCLNEIRRLQGEVDVYRQVLNQRLGGIASYEDIIRQIDGVPDPGSVPAPDLLKSSSGSSE